MFKSKTLPKILICLVALVAVLGLIYLVSSSAMAEANYSDSPYIQLNNNIKVNTEEFYDGTKVMKLPSNVKDSDIISVIVKTEAECLYDAYKASKSKLSFSEYIATEEAKTVRASIAKENEAIKAILNEKDIEYTVGNKYDTVLSGFEVLIKAGDFKETAVALNGKATPIVGEVYNKAETELVENKVNVYETGIFDSSAFKYDGTGMVVAVLDTGLDYTHTAFSVSNFGVKDESKLGLKYQDVVSLLANKDFYAEKMQSGLTANDVFINNKVPFGFDYADGDSEVFPINSDHGTHVAGIIAGKDDKITGVAPNAQLVIMKTFSDVESTARTSWILSALEDCVSLEVDVINMSLGTDCGFSRPSDKENVNNIYERIKEAGISLVVAASNSYNSTYGSEKNGNLGLTSNPDSATVGSPSTYDGPISIASISGVKTPYLLFGDRIIYFTESADRVSEEKVFLDDILKDGQKEAEIEFVTIPGVGRNADYTGIDVTGKIVLVRRGSSTFEEKADVAEQKGALGIIVYNNVSGDIKMNVGDAELGACSISQADGEILAAAKTGKIKIARAQVSGPFMSDFSSWGPTPSLGIKPELTAHGGSILSAVPGQDYDRISGTSMATPNMSGVSALLRQYVISELSHLVKTDDKIDNTKVTALVNCLLMSTADIVNNKNGLPYSVRKQGAGLANLVDSAKTQAYIITYDKDGNRMDKTKIELGDDPQKTGVYELNFSIMNFGNASLTYDLGYYVMTEGVSENKTSHGETTVTETAYILNGAQVVINSVGNGGSLSGSNITVEAGKTVDVKVTITLSDEDKKYLDDSFKNGMYVEGFITLDAVSGTDVDLGFPYLGFYGDWSKAPIFDLDFYATNKDELDDAIDIEDKTLPDAYATRPVGSLEGDYVNFMGSFYFEQDPSETPIAADRKYISLSNQLGAVNSLEYVWAGLLRNCQRIEVVITEDATGEVVFETVDYDIRKSYSNGQTIFPANVDIGFSAIEQNLKNNTKYTVTLKSYLDYENDGSETNANNTFTFPLVTDFEAPIVEGVEFYTEYDKANKETRLFAKIAIYDNHYAMGMQVGYVGDDGEGGLILNAFDQYIKAVYSDFNSTSYVVYELTDYIQKIKSEAYNKNTFTVACYDYALNLATYEIGLPDEYTDFYFDLGEDSEGNAITTVTLSPNQTYDLNPTVYPNTEWGQLLEFRSANTSVARIVNDKVIAVAPGTSRIIASYRDPETNTTKTATFTLKVLGEGDEGYKKYSKPVVDEFYLTGYLVERAFYFMNSIDREIGVEGDEMKFVGESYKLSMFPSEAVTIRYILDAYFPNATEVVFSTSNDKIASVDENGKITAHKEGYATITVKVMLDGKSTVYSKAISITVKDPYKNSGPMLTNYFGNGGMVVIPESLAITQIGQFAFSNYKYVPKQAWEIDPDSNETYKMWFVGDDTIKSIVIPEGVETIGAYAFANLTALEEITLPKSLKMIDQGAFYGCTKLTKVNGIENVKFINQYAFYGCNLQGEIKLDNAAAIGNYAFATGLIQDYYENKETGEAGWITKEAGKNELTSVILSEKTQSIGAYAFYGASKLENVTFKADKVQLGMCAFADCRSLKEISVNAQVIPTGIFDGCTSLEKITLGKDVAQIGEYAFRGATVKEFTVAEGNSTFYAQEGKPYILNKDGNELLYIAPGVSGELVINDSKITKVAFGAFSGNTNLTSVSIKSVTYVDSYAFAGCSRLAKIELGKLTNIGDYAFHNTAITTVHSLEGVTKIGAYAYAETQVMDVVIPDGMEIGEGAFRDCKKLSSIKIGNDVTIGTDAFRYNNMLPGNFTSSYYEVEVNGKTTKVYYYIYLSPLSYLEIGNNAKIGEGAFYGCAKLNSIKLGEGAKIGNYAFYNATSLKDIDLSKAVSIGDYAFSGDVLYEFTDENLTYVRQKDDGSYYYSYYAPLFTEIDLSSLTSLGVEAFAHCQKLAKVTLGDKITEVPQRAFANCAVLEGINLDKVEKIGLEAFAETAIKKLELYSVKEIGNYAFVYVDELTEVYLTIEVLPATVDYAYIEIGEGAFSYCESLEKLVGLSRVTKIDSYAFAYTDINLFDLTNATYIGDHAFMKEEITDVDVILGDKLTYIGENPFAMCKLDAFSQTVTESFNGKDYEKTIYTFDLSDTVKVIDGSIYKVVKNGLVLVTYAGEGDSITVAEDTVRISAMAFAGSDIKKVVLPRTVASIGHKAFYACDKLQVVSFSSYNAPILEEEYDYNYYASMENLPASGDYDFTDVNGDPIVIPGLGITQYFMYNVTGDPTNIYYGANFVDYIGKVENKLVMIRPANGKNYSSFIFGQYFNVVIDGDIAPDDITLEAISAINNLPEKVALSDKALVELARALYNKIVTNEQKSIVDENGLYAKLTAAEKRISDLEFLQNEDNKPQEPDNNTGNDNNNEEPTKEKLPTGAIVAIVILSVVAVASVAGCVVLGLPYIKKLIAKKSNNVGDGAHDVPSNDENDTTAGDNNEQ
ncbi:MAG: leucine-rich repeat protein [Clostridia bacterium]|nr:leucine-rich repeat protein [Clostridia bacterium]